MLLIPVSPLGVEVGVTNGSEAEGIDLTFVFRPRLAPFTVARLGPFLALVSLGLLGLLLNKRSFVCPFLARSHDLLTLGPSVQKQAALIVESDIETMASRALQHIVVPPITKHTATVIFLHVSITLVRQSGGLLP